MTLSATVSWREGYSLRQYNERHPLREITMATVPYPLITTTLVTVGDVLTRMPDVPPQRIRLVPTPGTATEADVLRVHAQEKVLCELVDGVLVEKAMGFRESVIAYNIGFAIKLFLLTHKLGIVAGESGMMRLLRGLVRMPDVSFVSWTQFPNHELPQEQIWSIYPDLAVEVLSPSNTAAEIERKMGEYFTAGTQLVWIADPPTQTVRVHTSPEDFAELTLADTLDGGNVLPWFTMPVEDVFRIE